MNNAQLKGMRDMWKAVSGNARMDFTRLVEKVMKMLAAWSEAWADPITMYAPSECATDISKWMDQDAEKLFAESGWTRDEFLAEAELRTSAKWVYVNLGQI